MKKSTGAQPVVEPSGGIEPPTQRLTTPALPLELRRQMAEKEGLEPPRRSPALPV